MSGDRDLPLRYHWLAMQQRNKGHRKGKTVKGKDTAT